MFSTTLLVVLLSIVAGSAENLATCAKVGENNVKTIKKFIYHENTDASGDETEEEVNKKLSKDRAIIELFAEKMSCLDAPAGKPFGYPGYDLKNVDRADCIAMVGAPKHEKISVSPWKSVDITWDTSFCGKRVWSHGFVEKMKGPDATAEHVHAIGIWEFNDAGKIIATRYFLDTLVRMKVLKLNATLAKKDEQLAEKEFADAAQQKWTQAPSLPIKVGAGTGGSNVRDAAFLACGVTLGVFGMRTWNWAVRGRGRPVGCEFTAVA